MSDFSDGEKKLISLVQTQCGFEDDLYGEMIGIMCCSLRDMMSIHMTEFIGALEDNGKEHTAAFKFKINMNGSRAIIKTDIDFQKGGKVKDSRDDTSRNPIREIDPEQAKLSLEQ
jgi:hypothetical protein